MASVVDPDHHLKLNVVFDQGAAKLVAWCRASTQGNDWIPRGDPDYGIAGVGIPDRDYLCIVSRTRMLDESTYQDLGACRERLGFRTENLIRAPHSRCVVF